MCKKIKIVLTVLLIIGLSPAIFASASRQSKIESARKELAQAGPHVLWCAPTDIASRDLFYGPGGKEDAPHTTFTFIREDRHGTSPKFDVHDEDGVKWTVKLGEEARPEVVATRLVWAVGYSTNEDYFLPELRVQGMPSQLHRGQNWVGPDGSIQNVRLKRHPRNERKVGNWRWRHNPFKGTRELNGLRVTMALINNWDLKDDNNSVYAEKRPKEQVYMVSDLGASFGATGRSWTQARSKGNLKAYSHSRFVSKVTPQYVDFDMPTAPAIIWVFNPKEYIARLRMRSIGKRIPRADVEWIGQLLAQLSPGQIRDAFRAAGYSPEEIEAFASVVEKRIAELCDLPRR